MADTQGRLEKQRVRQKALRERNKGLRRPTRDDFARMMLHLALDQLTRDQDIEELTRLQDGLVRRLVKQGFDNQQCYLAFEDLLDKYKKGWSFQKKVHLSSKDDADRE
jgi:hypothetical protein